jgi:hypothetical protein
MIVPSPDLTAERIESLKVGIFAAFALTISYSLTTLANHLLLAQFEQLAALQITSLISFGVKVATAFISGFLFGITYRYVIRQDDNSHLSEGAVLAFGIVRGLAPLEVTPLTSSSFWLLSVLGVESIVYFTLARFILDWAIRQQWVKPFNLS